MLQPFGWVFFFEGGGFSLSLSLSVSLFRSSLLSALRLCVPWLARSLCFLSAGAADTLRPGRLDDDHDDSGSVD